MKCSLRIFGGSVPGAVYKPVVPYWSVTARRGGTTDPAGEISWGQLRELFGEDQSQSKQNRNHVAWEIKNTPCSKSISFTSFNLHRSFIIYWLRVTGFFPCDSILEFALEFQHFLSLSVKHRLVRLYLALSTGGAGGTALTEALVVAQYLLPMWRSVLPAHAYTVPDAPGGQERVGFPATVSPMWVLGTKPWFSARTAKVLNRWAISPAP